MQTVTKMNAYSDIGDRIGALRRELKQARGVRVTQKELAGEVGVSLSSVTAWEIGKQRPEGENLLQLARVLDTTPEYILHGSEPEPRHFTEQVEDITQASDSTDAAMLPGVAFLKGRARTYYNERVGFYFTRGWPRDVAEQAAASLVAHITGMNAVRSRGTARPELTEDQQLEILEGSAQLVEQAFGHIGWQ